MGTGKSAVGRRASSLLDLDFLDSDAEIVRSEGRLIEDIFAQDGEAEFRRLESVFIDSGHPDAGCLVSCGGGMVVQPGVGERLARRGIVIVLFASPDTILSRISGNRKRPLLNVEDPGARIAELLRERADAYRSAGAGVSTDNRSIEEVADHVARIYRAKVA